MNLINIDKLRRNKIIAVLASALMVFSMMTSAITVLATDQGSSRQGRDVTGILMDLTSKVTQSNEDVTGGSLQLDKPINVSFSFRVPVVGDFVGDYDPSQVVSKGDTAVIELAEGFKLIGSQTIYELKQDEVKIATLTLAVDSVTGKLTANIVFDGDSAVFDGTDSGDGIWENVVCRVNCTLEYDADGENGTEGDHTVTILDKSYTVNVPVVPVIVSGTKTGTRNGGNIDWVVKVEGKKGTVDGDISGYVFNDNLTDVGKYIAGSFKVGETSDIGDAGVPAGSEGWNNSTAVLEYTFPEDTVGTRYLFFSTAIPQSKLEATGTQKISNIVNIQNGEKPPVTISGEVEFSTKWLEKADISTASERMAGSIKWAVTANQNGVYLPGATITDVLDSRLIWDSATIQYWDAGSESWTNSASIGQTEGVYALGDISTPVLLTIVAHMDNNTNNFGHTENQITNIAYLGWTGHTGLLPSEPVKSVIGINPIDKVGGKYHRANRTIPWTVKIKKSDVNTNLRLVDLLVYGDSGFSADGCTLTGADTTPISGINLSEITPRYGQSYVEGTFQPSVDSILEVIKYTVMKDGEAVADLLLVTGSGGGTIDPTINDQTYTYDTEVTNPAKYMGNTGFEISNTVMLYSANQLINSDTATVKCNTNTMEKDVLSASSAAKDLTVVNNVNASPGNAANSFNYKTKEVVFRLHINGNGVIVGSGGLSTAGNYKLDDIVVSDVLPDGWEFVNFSEDQPFLIYSGASSGDSKKVTAQTLITDTDSLVSAIYDKTGQGDKVEFNFDRLDGSYVILLKAAPKAEIADGYFSKNQTNQISNSAIIYNDSKNKELARDTENVSIATTLLSKSFTKVEDGILSWVVKYLPGAPNTPLSEVMVIDTLPEGLNLRVDSNGVLLLSQGSDKYITINKMTLTINGSYTVGEEVEPVLGENIQYNSRTSELTFIPGDTSQAYQITYITDVTADGGNNLENDVKISSGGEVKENVGKSYLSSSSDAGATMSRSGYIQISQKDDLGVVVNGGKFTIFAQDKSTVIRTASTVDGVLNIRGLSEGVYYLMETETPTGLIGSQTEYKIEIVKDEGRIITTVNGVTGSKVDVINRRTGSISVGIIGEDTQELLPGAALAIKDGDGNVVQSWDSTEENKNIQNLADGTYTLIQTSAPDGYVIVAPVEFTVENGIVTGVQDNTIIMTDKTTKVAISKTDISGINKIEGAALQIRDKVNNNLIEQWTSSSDSYVITKKLVVGRKYILQETGAPDGYAYAADIEFTVAQSEELQDVVMKDKITHISIVKTDVDTGTNISGAILEILDGSGVVVKTWETTSEAYEIKGELIAGATYTLHEVSAPEGYVCVPDIPFTVNRDGTINYITMQDIPTKVSIENVDATTGLEVPGAHLQIFDKEGGLIAEWISTDTAHIINGTLMAGETYSLHVEKASDGYAYGEDIEFIVNADGSITEVKLENDITKVTINKVDITTGENVPGAILQIVDENEEVIEEWTSTDEIYEITGKLVAGAIYTLREKKPADGYSYAGDIQFTVNMDGSVNLIDMDADITRVMIIQTELSTGETLPGVLLQIIDGDGKVIEEWTSTGEPYIIEGKLLAGKVYTLHEVSGPVGYICGDDVVFTVNMDGTVNRIVSNATIEPELNDVTEPETGDDNTIFRNIVLLLLSAFAVCGAGIKRRNNSKKSREWIF